MSSASDSASHTSIYSYDGEGRRVKRNLSGTETWQVYGLGGELLAEYAANTPAASPLKEYGYRNGQLLITARGVSAPRSNVALAANGATATAQNYTQDGVYPNMHFQPGLANDGVRHTSYDGDRYWRDEHGLPSSLEIDFAGSQTIDEIDVYTMGDFPFYTTQADPVAGQTFSQVQGATGYTVQYWNGSGWTTVPGGSVANNNLVWKQLNFTAVTTTKIRVTVNSCADNVACIVELEAWGTTAGLGSTADIEWLVTDQLGTPRMIFDKTGSLANAKRHDYLPFGEEVPGNFRSGIAGYQASDSVRQKFTLKERDNETGLDYSQARYYASTHGRFTGVDPLTGSGKPQLAQSWNRYSYCVNNPLVFIDPSGLIWGDLNNQAQWFETEAEMKKAGFSAMTQFLRRNPHGEGYLSFDRFQNYYEPVSSLAVSVGYAYGETPLREAGITTQSNLLFLLTDGIPNAVDYLYRTDTAQEVIHSPEADFCSVYSGVAGVEYGAARAFSEADSGLSMLGKAFEFRQLNKHLPGTAEAAKQLAVDGQAFVFNDLLTASRVESEIFARGIQTGSRGGVTRYGLQFDQPIGTQLFKDGGTRALNYGQLKLKESGLYHIMPRGGPGP